MLRKPVELMICLIGVVITGTSAQTLDLGGGSSPVVDSSTASSELASFLDAQAEAIETDDNLLGGLKASAAVRRLAGSLLRDGQSRGTRGTPRLVIGRTVVSNLSAIDDTLNGPTAVLTDAQASLLATDCSALASQLPATQHDLDRALRDALAPLTNAVELEVSGWPMANSPLAPTLGALIELQTVQTSEQTEARASSLVSIDDLLTRARAWPSHRLAAYRIEALVRSAAAVLQLERWVDSTSHDALTAAFDRSIDRVARGIDAESALTSLEQLGTIARAAKQVDSLKQLQLRRRAQSRFNTLLTEFETDPRRVAQTSATIERVFTDANEDQILERERTLPTFARVAWRDAEGGFESSGERLINSMLEAMTAANPMTEPALLSAIRAHRQSHEFLQDIVDIGAYLTGIDETDDSVRGRPSILTDRRRLAARVLALGKQLADPNEREDALSRLTTIAALVRATQPFAHEQSFRSVQNGSANAMHRQVIDALDSLHADAQATLMLQQPASPEADASRLIDQAKRWTILLTAKHAHHQLDSVGQERLQAWAPWELTEHGWSMLLDALPEQLESATRALFNDEPIDAEAFAIAHLASVCLDRLELYPQPAAGAAGLLAQIALGTPPPGSFGLIDREPIASICLDLEELASAILRGEQEREASLRARSAQSAMRVIERMNAEAR